MAGACVVWLVVLIQMNVYIVRPARHNTFIRMIFVLIGLLTVEIRDGKKMESEFDAINTHSRM